MNLSNLIGQNVLSYKGETVGYTRCACFSSRFKKVTALLCSDMEEEDFLLPLSSLPEEGKPLVFTHKSKAKTTLPYSPLSRPVYSESGKFLGHVSEMHLDNDLVPQSIAVGETVYPIKSVTAFGDCILVNLRRRESPPAAPSPVSKEPFVLLGKKIKADIKDDDGKILFSKGATITPFTLKKAVRYNKTVELTAKTLHPSQTE